MNKKDGPIVTFHHLEMIIKFIRQNWIALSIGLFAYSMYLYFTYAGNRICDCESTERSAPAARGTSVNRFYHK